jgi:hypothetical protein
MAGKRNQSASAPSGLKRLIAKALGDHDGQGVEPKQKIMAGTVGVLVIGFMIVIIRTFTGPAPAEAAPPLPAGPQRAGPAPAAVAHVVAEDPTGELWPAVERYPADLRDPMVYVFPEDAVEPEPDPEPVDPAQPVEVVVEEDPLPVLRVSAVMMSDAPEAVVNDEFLGVGDVIQGATVVKIGLDSVEFEKDGQRWIEYRQD